MLAHSRALLATDDGVIAVKADLREPAEVLGDPAVAKLIDFSQPVAVLIMSVLHFIGDEEGPAQIVTGYTDRIVSGSYLALSAISSEDLDESTADGASDLYRSARTPAVARSGEQMTEFFGGCDLVDPGLVDLVKWRPELDTDTKQTQVHMLAGVARKR